MCLSRPVLHVPPTSDDYWNLKLCRSIQRLIDNDPNLLYKIDLILAGMEDGLSSRLSIGPKRELLKRHQFAHNTLSPEDLSIEEEPELAKDPWLLSDGVLSHFVSRSLIKLKSLPSIMRGIPEQTWELRLPVGFSVRALVVDLAQDLAVVLELGRGVG